MNFPLIISSIAINIISNLLYDLGKNKLSILNKDHPIKKAILKIADEFKDIENLPNTLEDWLEKEDVKIKLKEFEKGDRDIDIKILSDALAKDTNFYLGEETQEKSFQIIHRFFFILNEEYLKSKEGFVYSSYRQEDIAQRDLGEHRKTQESIETIRVGITKIDTLLLSKITQVQVEEYKGKYETQYTKRIDEARNLLNNGKVKTAKVLYENLLDDILQERDLSSEIKFRVFTNLACCELALGLNKEAVFHFELAHKILPDDNKSLVNMAIVQMLQKEYEKGLEYVDKVLEKDSNYIHGICVKANLLTNLKRYDDAINIFKIESKKEFDKKLLEDTQCCYVLGLVYFENKDYINSKKFFKQAVESDPNNPDYLSLLALSICSPYIQKKFLSWLISDEIKEELEEAEKYFSKTIQILDSWEIEKKIEDNLVNRSSIRLLLGKIEEATDDCNEVLKINPNNSLVYKNKGLSEFKSNKLEIAIVSLTKAIELGEKAPELIPIIAICFNNKKTPELSKVIELIEKYFPQREIKEDNLEVNLVLVDYFIRDKKYQEAKILLKELQKTFSNNPRVLSSFGEYCEENNEKEEAEFFFLEGFKYAVDFEKQIISLKLGDFYYKQNLYDNAIKFYKEVVNLSVNNRLLQNYLGCLYYSTNKSENYTICLEICRKIREIYGVTEFVSEVEAVIQEELRNLKEASELYLELSKIEPEKYIHKLRYGIIEFRKGNTLEAIKIFEEIKDKIKDNVSALMTIAECLSYVGRTQEAIPIGYKALRLSPNDSHIHFAYIHLFLCLGDEDNKELNPTTVKKDTVITLCINGDTKTYALKDLSDTKTLQDISVNSDLGKLLLNHKVGDKIKIGEDILTSKEIEILEIKSKYVEAFQDSIDSFNERFIREKGLQKIKVGKDFKNIFKILDDISQRASMVTDFYKQRKLTIGAMSKLLGRDLFDTWSGFISISDLSLICATGTFEEQKREEEIINQTQKVIIDLIGLFTLTHLDCLDLLSKLFQEVYVSQSCLDEIIQIIGSEGIHKRGYMTVGKYQNGYIKGEITSENVQKNIDFLNKIKDFLINNTNKIGFKKPLIFSEQVLRQMLGVSSLDTLKIAKENNLPLYSDDKYLRELGFFESKIEGFSIQTLLQKSLKENLINEDEYNEKITKLVLSKYSFIFISAQTLLHSVTKSEYDLNSQETISLLQTIESVDTSIESALNVLSHFVKLIWMQPLLFNKKIQYLDLSLRTLTKKRGIINTVGKFKEYIRRIFPSMLYYQMQEVLENISMWEKSRRIVY